MKRITGWYRGKRRRTRILLAALVVLLCMGSVYWGVREAAIRIADHLTVTATCTQTNTACPTVGAVIFQHTFGRTLAADAEHILNDETVSMSPFDFRIGGSTLDGGSNWHYHLAFTWRGILVETMDVTCEALPEYYTISALGLVAPWRVESSSSGLYYGSVMDHLSNDSGGVIPPPEAKTWPPAAGS